MQHRLLEIYQRLEGPWTLIRESDAEVVARILLPAKYYILSQPGVVATFKGDDLLGKDIIMFVHIVDTLDHAAGLQAHLTARAHPVLEALYRYREAKAAQNATRYRTSWKTQAIADWSAP